MDPARVTPLVETASCGLQAAGQEAQVPAFSHRQPQAGTDPLSTLPFRGRAGVGAARSRRGSVHVGPREALLMAALGLVGLGSVLFGVSQEEIERYGFGSEIARSAQAGVLRQLPRTVPRRRPPPMPILPKTALTPSNTIPAPTRKNANIVLTPKGPAIAARTGRPVPVRPAEPSARPDPMIQSVFPEQIYDTYVGDEACLSCHGLKGHDQPHSLYGLIKNNRGVEPERRGCEGCHGPGSTHSAGDGVITNPARLDHVAVSRLCLSCHEDRRLVRRLEWHVTGHQEAFVSCTTCHSAHRPKVKPALAQEPDRLCLGCHRDQKMQFRLRSHHPVKPEGSDALSSTREGKVRCIDCHNPQSARHGVDLLAREGRGLCGKCHAEARGPFLFEHDVASGDTECECTACHLPHGSPNRDLLVVQGRALCLRCHTDRVAHNPGPSCYNAQCHRDHHGSNRNQFFLPR
ncbi:MAG: cytochrome c3 family protein [Candidatus Riflebacteria bacterium]|nr:cytochrome c3 family protein [Candidatus Riflebacteria bacterium]